MFKEKFKKIIDKETEKNPKYKKTFYDPIIVKKKIDRNTEIRPTQL